MQINVFCKVVFWCFKFYCCHLQIHFLQGCFLGFQISLLLSINASLFVRLFFSISVFSVIHYKYFLCYSQIQNPNSILNSLMLCFKYLQLIWRLVSSNFESSLSKNYNLLSNYRIVESLNPLQHEIQTLLQQPQSAPKERGYLISVALERGLNASGQANIQPASDRVTDIR